MGQRKAVWNLPNIRAEKREGEGGYRKLPHGVRLHKSLNSLKNSLNLLLAYMDRGQKLHLSLATLSTYTELLLFTVLT
jgi:hypothetical protein